MNVGPTFGIAVTAGLMPSIGRTLPVLAVAAALAPPLTALLPSRQTPSTTPLIRNR